MRPTLEQVREFFKDDRFATDAGMVIESVCEDGATCSMVIDERHQNAVGAVMGGVFLTLSDFTYAVAVNWQGARAVSLELSTSFLGQPKGNKLIAEAKCVKRGSRTCCYRIDITDELGTSVCATQVTGFYLKHED